MGKEGMVRTTCGLCYTGCGILIDQREGQHYRILGDPDSPVNRGIVCEKALASFDYLNHPERLRYPLRRKGERGEGRWDKVSWDEALETVAHGLDRLKERYGPESVAFIQGAAKGLQDTYLSRFANVFGSPNFVSHGYVCVLPRKFGSEVTFGFWPSPDYDHLPACVVVWGSFKSKVAEFHKTLEAKSRGAKLLVVDPRCTSLARNADLWIRIRPGSDLALALGLIQVVVQEDLYDKDFVDSWTSGFEELVRHVQDYTPRKVAKITWVPEERIRGLARLYAQIKPACIQMGNAFEHTVNSLQTARALSILKAITGNIGIPGGEVYWKPLPIIDRFDPRLTLQETLPKDKESLRLGSEMGFLPLYRYAHPPSVIKAMAEGVPYPVKGAYIQGANPLLTYPNARETHRAFEALTFLAVADHFMTPTAAMADIVLPAATYLEFDSLVYPPYYPIAQLQQRVAHVEDCRSDFEILGRLALKMGMGKHFQQDGRKFLDMVLAPAGIDFEKFRACGPLVGERLYEHFKAKGFDTPSGKVELFSRQLEAWNLDPMPVYREPPETPLSAPDLALDYPLVLTSWKSPYYRHSGGRQIRLLRELHPDPVILIHPKTASALGIHPGDWVRVVTRRGHIKQKALFSEDLDPRVVGADYAWWFPERGAETLYGWDESNLNILTDHNQPYGREIGSANLRGFLCRVEKE
jgi:anaerobic selenocysteine-containing dehydrogenase